MAIHSSANAANVRRSVEKYLVDTFQGATGIPTDVEKGSWWWQGRKFDSGGVNYFVRPRLDEVGREFHSRVSSTAQGYAINLLLTIEVYVKRVKYDTDPHALESVIAMLRNGLTRGTSIAIKDYDEGGSTTVATAHVQTLNPSGAHEEGDWRRQMLEVLLSYVEQDTTS